MSQSSNDLTSQAEGPAPSARAGPSSSQLSNSAVVSVIGITPLVNRVVEAAQASTAPPPNPAVSAPADPAAAPEPAAPDIARITRAASADQPRTGAVTPSGTASGTPLTGHMAAAYELGINIDHLRQLMDMGFSVEMCIEALITSTSLHQATDYLLNANTTQQQQQQQQPQQPSAVAAALVAAVTAPPVAPQTAPPTTATTPAASTDPPDQEMLRLFNNLKSEEALEHLKAEDLDSFTETIMDQCLKILDTVPETVYRVCELLVAVGQRNGSAWMKETLTGIVAQVRN